MWRHAAVVERRCIQRSLIVALLVVASGACSKEAVTPSAANSTAANDPTVAPIDEHASKACWDFQDAWRGQIFRDEPTSKFLKEFKAINAEAQLSSDTNLQETMSSASDWFDETGTVDEERIRSLNAACRAHY